MSKWSNQLIDAMPTPAEIREAIPLCVVCGWKQLEPGRPQVCVPCELRIGQHLDLLAVATPLLAVVASTEPSAGRIPVKLLPLDLTLPPQTLPVVGLERDQIGAQPIATTLGLWVEDWTGRDVITASAVSSAGVLREQLTEACRTHDAIDEFAREIRGLVAVARQALGRNLQGVRYGTPCPSCGTKTLVRIPGADWIECGPCGRLWDEEAYARLTVDTLRKAVPDETLLTIREAAMLTGERPGNIRKWIHRDRLSPLLGPSWGKTFVRYGDLKATQREVAEIKKTRAEATARLKAKREMVMT